MFNSTIFYILKTLINDYRISGMNVNDNTVLLVAYGNIMVTESFEGQNVKIELKTKKT